MKAFLPGIIRCMVLAVISCSAVAQEKHTAPPKEKKPETTVTLHVPLPFPSEASTADVSPVKPVIPAIPPLKQAPENGQGFIPIPLWRGEGAAIPIPPSWDTPPSVPVDELLRLLELSRRTQQQQTTELKSAKSPTPEAKQK